MSGLFYNLGRMVGPKVRKAKWIWQSMTGSEADAIKMENEVGRDLAREIRKQLELDDELELEDEELEDEDEELLELDELLEELELELIDFGLEEIEEDVEPQENDEDKAIIRIFGEFASFGELSKGLEDMNIEVTKAELQRIANAPIDLAE